MTHFGHREVRARINARRAREDLQRTQIAHTNHVKLAIRQFRIGSNLHPTTKITRIRDTEIRNNEMALVRIVELDHETYGLVAHRRLHECGRERNTVSFYSLDDFRTHAARGDPNEIPRRIASIVIDIRDSPYVNSRGLAGAKDSRSVTRSRRNLECSSEIAACAAGQDAELHVFS